MNDKTNGKKNESENDMIIRMFRGFVRRLFSIGDILKGLETIHNNQRKIMADQQTILEALKVNGQAIAKLGDAGAQSQAKVLAAFDDLKLQLQGMLTPTQFSDIEAGINKSTEGINAAITTFGKISEIGAQTDPGTPSPVAPIPPTEVTPVNTEPVPADATIEDVTVEPSPANVGGEGTVNIDLVVDDEDPG